MKKIIFLIIVIGVLFLLYFYINKNNLVDSDIRIESGVEVTVNEYSKPYSSSDFSNFIKGYNSNDWSISLLTPPAYPYIYKLGNKQSGNEEVVVWYSGKYLLIFKAEDLLKDGQSEEQVLENYIESYPSSIDPNKKSKSRALDLLSSLF